MKYFDIKPQPKSHTYQDWKFWLNRMQTKLLFIGRKPIHPKVENDNDWEFVVIDRGDGVKGIAVF